MHIPLDNDMVSVYIYLSCFIYRGVLNLLVTLINIKKSGQCYLVQDEEFVARDFLSTTSFSSSFQGDPHF